MNQSSKKELDNPSKIIDLHKDLIETTTHEVSGRKGVDPSSDVVTEITPNVDHVDDLNKLKSSTTKTSTKIRITTTKITTSTEASTTSKNPEVKKVAQEDPTPRTSLLVGVILACILLSVVAFVGFKRLDAIRRRREYRRMNDYLIDGMYNEM